MTGVPSDELPLAAERAFGAFWDALGLGGVREFQQGTQALVAAASDEFAAQARYAWVATGAWSDGLQRFVLAAGRPAQGEAPTPLALLRRWVEQLDAACHAALQSQPGLQATAATVRACSRRRLAQQQLADLGSESLGLPTRREVDDAFREIQELKREVRRLRRITLPQPEESPHG